MTKALIQHGSALTAPDGDVVPVEHADVNADHKNDEHVVHQPKDSEHRFRDNVQR